jgi:enoyl-CoA hydratase/carnithine racemase
VYFGFNEKVFELERSGNTNILRLVSVDNTNRLTRSCVLALTDEIHVLALNARPLIITGNHKFFSVGADLNEIAALAAADAYAFSQTGQTLTNAIASFPTQVIAAVEGHCMGGGFDLALACHRRIAAPNAVFGHRARTVHRRRESVRATRP